MKIKKLIFGIFLLFASILPVRAQQIHPITKAMLDGYDQLLRENPNDWLTLYERASQYYHLNEYDKALDDILRALVCTPSKEKEQLVSEYSLASDIYLQKGEYENALSQIDSALNILPGDYALIYQKGNICLYLGNVEEARKCFNSMLRLKSRSQEAMFGLAKCAVMDKNYSEAMNYLDLAEKVDPSNYITYCRIGDIYADMGETQNASASYLSAFSLNSRDDRSLKSLIELGKKDYPAVVDALDYAIGKTSNTVPLYFLKGNIAREANQPDDAYEAYLQLMKTAEGNAPEVVATMAEICRDRNSLTEAIGYINRAIADAPTIKNRLLKASIEYDLGNYEIAGSMVEDILSQESENLEALMLATECMLAVDNLEKATEYINLAVGINPLDMRPLLLRGYMAKKYGITELPGNNDFVRAIHLEADNDIKTVYKAIAQQLDGKNLDAAETMHKYIDKSTADSEAAYLTALFYASTDNVTKGREALENARKLGFSNKYLLESYSVPLFSVAPLR